MTHACPNCKASMQRRAFERKPTGTGTLDVDLCFPCHGIWFDRYESAQLTPGAVIELFREIHAHQEQPPVALGARQWCPVCRGPLTLTHDIQRTNRIAYHRCATCQGRFTTFFQFLREKSFVRTLTMAEVAHLKESVKQVRCSSCGAPIDLERATACNYCQAPISMLDPNAVKLALNELASAERNRQHVEPTAAMDGMLAGQRVSRRLARIESRPGPMDWADAASSTSDIVDLVADALSFIMSE
jgi:Zn-finger nucleic acid-binding protein